MNAFRKNAVIIGALFILTMLAGMLDAYYVAPELKATVSNIPSIQKLLVGVFSILAMALGIVLIAIAFFPVVKTHSETLALTYVIFRTIECFLLIIGVISYLYIITLSGVPKQTMDASSFAIAVGLAVKIKYYGYQIAMIVLGIGSLFLCYSLYASRLIPRFLSVWGAIGYSSLLLSAVLDICGIIDTTSGLGIILYLPGGLWEMLVFPVWLFIKGFSVPAISSTE